MTARRPLPEPLRGRAFTVVEARASGVSVNRLRAGDLDAGFRGVRLPAAAGLRTRARAALLASPPGTVISGPTAALLHGLPIPRRLTPELTGVIDVAVRPGERTPRKPGIAGRALHIEAADLIRIDGIPITRAERTWCDLAPACSVPELVAVADRLHAALLADALQRHPGRRYRSKLRVALDLQDRSAESPPESVQRALVVLAGLPRPMVNPVIRDGGGRFVARVDQLFETYREILEYQGDHHRTDVRQWRRDRTREATLESLGYHVMEVTAADLARPRELVERIAANLARRGWRGRLHFSPHFPGAGDP